jgi:hypothetical protein
LSVQYYCAASLDGYIAEVDDTIEWLTGYDAVPPGEAVSPVEGGSTTSTRMSALSSAVPSPMSSSSANSSAGVS